MKLKMTGGIVYVSGQQDMTWALHKNRTLSEFITNPI